MVTLGTGVGTALFTNGELVPNTELGHLELDGKIADIVGVGRDARTQRSSAGRNGPGASTCTSRRLHALLWPDLIVLGGGVVKHADKFLDRLDPGCEVRIAQLGNNAGIVGAALAASGAQPHARLTRRRSASVELGAASTRRHERPPRVTGAEEAVLAGGAVAAGDVVLGRAGLPRLEDRVDDAPGPLDLVEAQERRVVAFEHVEQQRLRTRRLRCRCRCRSRTTR